MSITDDHIQLQLPFKAEYVSIARLTASGVANRLGFDIESIEDIKVAISEVCNKLVSTGSTLATQYQIDFGITEKCLTVSFACSDSCLKCDFYEDKEAELGISLITALMDEVEFSTSETFLLSLKKNYQ